VIKSVKGSTQIQQHKNSVVSSISHYQQIVRYAKDGRLGAMTTSVRRLKLNMQTVCVEVCLQLVGNRSLKDLGQIGSVGHRTVVTEDLGVKIWRFYQWFNHCFFESNWHSTRCETQIDYFLFKKGRRTSVNSRTSVVGAGSTVAVADFDSRMSFRIWSSERA